MLMTASYITPQVLSVFIWKKVWKPLAKGVGKKVYKRVNDFKGWKERWKLRSHSVIKGRRKQGEKQGSKWEETVSPDGWWLVLKLRKIERKSNPGVKKVRIINQAQHFWAQVIVWKNLLVCVRLKQKLFFFKNYKEIKNKKHCVLAAENLHLKL